MVNTLLKIKQYPTLIQEEMELIAKLETCIIHTKNPAKLNSLQKLLKNKKLRLDKIITTYSTLLDGCYCQAEFRIDYPNGQKTIKREYIGTAAEVEAYLITLSKLSNQTITIISIHENQVRTTQEAQA